MTSPTSLLIPSRTPLLYHLLPSLILLLRYNPSDIPAQPFYCDIPPPAPHMITSKEQLEPYDCTAHVLDPPVNTWY